MIDINATLQITLVLATTPLLRALLLASSVIRSGRQLLTLDHLVHLSTATLDRCRLLTRRTRSQVTLGYASMGIRGHTAAQYLIADGITKRDLIQARLSLRGQYRFLATRATPNSFRCQLTVATRIRMTCPGTLVILAVQLFLACILARKLHILQILSGTWNRLLCIPTVTLVFQSLSAVLARSRVALLAALMQSTVTHLIAESIACYGLLLRTDHGLDRGSTTTLSSD